MMRLRAFRFKWTGAGRHYQPGIPRRHDNRSRIDAFGLFTGQIGYAWNNALL
jgi:hypothetical protein